MFVFVLGVHLGWSFAATTLIGVFLRYRAFRSWVRAELFRRQFGNLTLAVYRADDSAAT
jgi:hypothetical protein